MMLVGMSIRPTNNIQKHEMVLQSLACGFEINGNVCARVCVVLGLHHCPV